MSVNSLPEHYTINYAQNWLHRIQQMPSRLAATVMNDEVMGFEKRYAQLESQAMSEITVRHGTTAVADADTFHRWLKTKKHDLTNRLDEWDQKELGVLVSPQGDLVVNHGFSYNRLKDNTIILAAEGNANTGEDGTTLTALPSTQRILVDHDVAGTDTQLTLGKVSSARRIFNENDLDLDGGAFAVISPKADESLIRDVDQARNKDYGSITPITDGTLNGKYWMGFNWIVHTGLTSITANGSNTTATTTADQCLFYHKSCMKFGDGEKRSSIDILPENSHAIQIRTRTRMGALRMEEKGVVIVESDNS
jgi:hypothetical protein